MFFEEFLRWFDNRSNSWKFRKWRFDLLDTGFTHPKKLQGVIVNFERNRLLQLRFQLSNWTAIIPQSMFPFCRESLKLLPYQGLSWSSVCLWVL